jgi:hypothetical protein
MPPAQDIDRLRVITRLDLSDDGYEALPEGQAAVRPARNRFWKKRS